MTQKIYFLSSQLSATTTSNPQKKKHDVQCLQPEATNS